MPSYIGRSQTVTSLTVLNRPLNHSLHKSRYPWEPKYASKNLEIMEMGELTSGDKISNEVENELMMEIPSVGCGEVEFVEANG